MNSKKLVDGKVANKVGAIQGDVGITRRKFPEYVRSAGTPKENGVVAEGEKTGHFHEFMALDEKSRVEVIEVKNPETDREELWVELFGPNCVLVHPEHAPISYKSGQYLYVAQREYEGAGRDFLVPD